MTLADALSRAGAEVEGLHGVTVDVVAVGDLALDDRLRALVINDTVPEAAKTS